MKPRRLEAIERRLIARFQREALEYADEIDPEGNLDWHSLAIGFFVAAGLKADAAIFCAVTIVDRITKTESSQVKHEPG